MKLYQYVTRRLVLSVFVLLAVSIITFVLLRGPLPPEAALAPYVSPRDTPQVKLQIAQNLGVATAACPSFAALTAHNPICIVPLYQQYLAWLWAVLNGNWGYSMLPNVAANELTWNVFFDRFGYTAELAIISSLLTIIVAIPLGIISATHNNKPPDHASRLFAMVGYSLPIFVFGYLLQLIFGLYLTIPVGGHQLGVFPISGAFSTTCGLCFPNPGTIGTFTGAPLFDSILSVNFAYFWDSLMPMILPSATLAITTIAALTRVLRSSMLEALRQDYVLLARSKGLRDRVVIYRHALRNALLPAITISGLIVAFLFGGVVIIEIVFALPGIGNEAVLASLNFDKNFLELYVLITAFIIVAVNLVVDIIYARLDPRIRY